MALLTEIQRIPTTGARAVCAFALAGGHWLAIPQLAADAAGSPPGINGGSSDTEVLLLRDTPNGFVPAGTLPVGGGEDAEAFELDGRSFLAVASIRSGSGPYDFATRSPIFVSEGGGFVPFQSVDSFAAKQWRFFRAGGSTFLGLAQNLPSGDRSSLVLRWDGTRFAPFQEIESKAGYNFAAFDIDGDTYLAHADHVLPTRLYRFDGDRFVEHQSLLPAGGRAFQLIEDGAVRYLAVARIDGDSVLLRWNGTEFVPHDTLPGGPGGREFAWVETPRGRYLVRVDFIHGTPAEPQPDLRSHIYRYEGGRLETVVRFPTTGGTDVTVLPGDGTRLAVSNGLSAAPEPGSTFGAETVVYGFDDSEGD